MPKYLRKEPRLTVKRVEQAVRDLGYKGVRLYHHGGRYGYYYWSGGVATNFHEQGVYGLFRLNDYSLRQWINDFKDRLKDKKRREYKLSKSDRASIIIDRR